MRRRQRFSLLNQVESVEPYSENASRIEELNGRQISLRYIQIHGRTNMLAGVMIMSIMMAMTIKVTRVIRMKDMPDMVQAHVAVKVPGLNARALIDMAFPAPAGSNRTECAEIDYDKALTMLDPA